MWVLRTEPELVLKSRWVVPGMLTEAGFAFRHPHFEPAVRELATRWPARPRRGRSAGSPRLYQPRADPPEHRLQTVA
ncbi:DUF1731 domain-containing protein [Microbacterium sp. zg.Y818]|uniref:DUF1731 domain-containing protein n=1 Tax=Microbacterium sp. zg.Y818 TaxID=2969412 RepID=UPI0035AB7BAF